MSARKGMALPAAIAAMIILAGLAALANISATASIQESRALRDAAVEHAQREAIRARAMLQLARKPRVELVGGNINVGVADTSLAVRALAWPWHAIDVSAGGTRVFSEFGRATIPNVVWCNAVVYANVADIAVNTLAMAPPYTCPDRLQAGASFLDAFDSTVVADLVGVASPDTVVVADVSAGVIRATRTLTVTSAGAVTGLVIAPVVKILGGGTVRGLVIARDTVVVASGALVTADFNAVFGALADRARIVPLGRRGMVVLP